MVDKQDNISQKMIQLRRTQWVGQDDFLVEHPLTYRANLALNNLLDGMSPLLRVLCPQDIEDFNIVGKSDGELGLQWHGPVFELDIDIESDGRVSFLLCPTGSTEDRWISKESVEVKVLLGFIQVLTSPDWW